MNLQMCPLQIIKSIDGKDAFVLVPVNQAEERFIEEFTEIAGHIAVPVYAYMSSYENRLAMRAREDEFQRFKRSRIPASPLEDDRWGPLKLSGN